MKKNQLYFRELVGRKKKAVYSGIFVILCIFLFQGALYAQGQYHKGAGYLIWGHVNPNDVVMTTYQVPPWSMEELKRRLDEQMPNILNAYQTAGVAVAFMDDYGNIKGLGYGLEDISKKTPVDPDKTLFQVASLSKPVSAFGAVMMEENNLLRGVYLINGKLVLGSDNSQPLSNSYLINYVPTVNQDDWQITTSGNGIVSDIAKITLDDLIKHRSGLDQTPQSWGDNQGYWGYTRQVSSDLGDPYLYQRNLFNKLVYSPLPSTNEQLNGDDNNLPAKIIFPLPNWNKTKVKLNQTIHTNDPKNDVRYSTGAYTVLQLVMQNIYKAAYPIVTQNIPEHKLFAYYMRTVMDQTLGMNNSTFVYEPSFFNNNRRMASSYETVFWSNSNGSLCNPISLTKSQDLLWTIKAGGGLMATANDYAKFLVKLMSYPTNSNIPYYKRVLEPYISGPDDYLGLAGRDIMDGEYWQHTGAQGNWKSCFDIHPGTNDFVVILTNSGNSILVWGGEGVYSEIVDGWRAVIDYKVTPH
jgi:CubicO group peptidase (beta-lactamase class C family)